MNILDSLTAIDFSKLDQENPGSWPFILQIIIGVIVCIGIIFGAYQVVWQGQQASMRREDTEIQRLQDEFRIKYSQGVNILAYREQLEDAKKAFESQLRQLPTGREVEDLLDDLTGTSIEAGLDFKSIKMESEVATGDYIEQPIKIELIGDYHKFVNFVTDVSKIPRIVTVQAFKISPTTEGSGQNLTIDATAKTFRYKQTESEEEQ